MIFFLFVSVVLPRVVLVVVVVGAVNACSIEMFHETRIMRVHASPPRLSFSFPFRLPKLLTMHVNVHTHSRHTYISIHMYESGQKG